MSSQRCAHDPEWQIVPLTPLVFFKTAALGIGTKLQGDRRAVGPFTLGSAHTPEIGHPGLVIRIALEILAEDHHGLAA